MLNDYDNFNKTNIGLIKLEKSLLIVYDFDETCKAISQQEFISISPVKP